LAFVKLLGDASGQYIDVVEWKQDDSALYISLPSKPAESHAYVLKLSFNDYIPVPQIDGGASLFTSNTTKGPGISLPRGEFLPVFFSDAGFETEDVRFLRVSSGVVVAMYANRDFSGNAKVYEAGEHNIEAGALGSIKVAPA
jgi:alpha-L-fucosidase